MSISQARTFVQVIGLPILGASQARQKAAPRL